MGTRNQAVSLTPALPRSDEGLEDEEELQAWFLARINTFLRSRGRQLVGWDEVSQGFSSILRDAHEAAGTLGS